MNARDKELIARLLRQAAKKLVETADHFDNTGELKFGAFHVALDKIRDAEGLYLWNKKRGTKK